MASLRYEIIFPRDVEIKPAHSCATMRRQAMLALIPSVGTPIPHRTTKAISTVSEPLSSMLLARMSGRTALAMAVGRPLILNIDGCGSSNREPEKTPPNSTNARYERGVRVVHLF
jgi:hypothetical protein